MKHTFSKISLSTMMALGALTLCQCGGPITQINTANVNGRQLAANSRTALNQLYSTNPEARKLGARARGILVFPEITKGGFIFGGFGGNGALIRQDGTIRDFYQTAGVSYGLQAGIQRFGYALFLMDDAAMRSLNSADGWEIGSSPSIVIFEEGMSTALTTTTMRSGTVAFFFNQRGLMAGVGLRGSKITRIDPPR
jgi:lipid-binding SYLF domain-containing protein